MLEQVFLDIGECLPLLDAVILCLAPCLVSLDIVVARIELNLA